MNFYEMPFVIYFRIDKWTESMLSITSSQECSIFESYLCSFESYLLGKHRRQVFSWHDSYIGSLFVNLEVRIETSITRVTVPFRLARLTLPLGAGGLRSWIVAFLNTFSSFSCRIISNRSLRYMYLERRNFQSPMQDEISLHLPISGNSPSGK